MDLIAAVQEGSANPLVLVGMALILGALHGLEPGHSKTMMAAFIIAVHGTVSQAVLLGVSAAVSHSLIVWVLAMIALQFGADLIGETTEAYFLMGSGVLIIVISFWMLRRMLEINAVTVHKHHPQAHEHDHKHHPVAQDDSHAQAHAIAVQKKFASGKTTTWQTIMFGFSGGLIPCSAAITVFILCLHQGKVSLGVGLVAAFSIGLALVFVSVGVVVSIGMRVASEHTTKLEYAFQKAPYVSVVIVAVIGLFMTYSGYTHLNYHPV
ncbi:MAG: nickel/cobalt efflux transporter RcnA [Rhodospirillales bacterium]|jgi:nickel/cobalt transporter (NicO) family protein|nr:nickel/cobalt efflux transporter RcnA [Rhodospirillales bacterium]MBT7355592.1 nickel/cobalt efflux transporter RcnA [Rhodospirillaceae bacterium]